MDIATIFQPVCAPTVAANSSWFKSATPRCMYACTQYSSVTSDNGVTLIDKAPACIKSNLQAAGYGVTRALRECVVPRFLPHLRTHVVLHIHACDSSVAPPDTT